MRWLTGLLVRAALLLAGLIFAASLLLAVLVLAVVWSAAALWARATGRPVPGFAWHFSPRARFARTMERARAAGRWSRGPDGRPRPAAGGISDVWPRPAATAEPDTPSRTRTVEGD